MDSSDKLRSFSRCTAFCTADAYDLKDLCTSLKAQGYQPRLNRDVLHVPSRDHKEGDVFFFNFGCVVCWGFSESDENEVLADLPVHEVQPIREIEADHFYYRIGDESTIETDEHYRVDVMTLESDGPLIKLAFSYALAQSIKLEAFEEEVIRAVKKNSSIPEEIATRGKIRLSRKAIFKRMGEIFIARSSINLNLEYLDVPEFFWRNPALEPQYIMVNKFLDIDNRVAALNQRLDVLQELLDMLNTQVQHFHESLLEIIIILLIFVEIVISVFQFHLV